MANALYGKGKKKIGTKQIDLVSDAIAAYLVSSGYSPSINIHEFVSDLGANILSGPIALTGKVLSDTGVFDASPVTFPSVPGGDTATYVVLAKNTGVSGTSPLLVLYDTISNFPALTNGGDIEVADTGGAYQWFSL